MNGPRGTVVAFKKRPTPLVEAIRQLREARIALISVYRITEAAELQRLIERLQADR